MELPLRKWGVFFAALVFLSANAFAQSEAAGGDDSLSSTERKPLIFNVKTNLLYDAAGFPSLEAEIPIGMWSVNIEGAVAWWSSSKKNTFYQLDMISPEVRRWFGCKDRWHGHYVGLFGIVGLYDLEWKGGRGYQGEYWSVGISYGYMFPVTKDLSFEAGIGLGYLRSEPREYLPMDGHYVYQQTSRIGYWGPVKLKFGLVWNITARRNSK